jgi:hypothetical protein
MFQYENNDELESGSVFGKNTYMPVEQSKAGSMSLYCKRLGSD